MILEKNNLETVQAKSELNLTSSSDSLICTPKNSIAIMALDRSRLGLENKFLETNQAKYFAFDKFTLQNLANKSGDV